MDRDWPGVAVLFQEPRQRKVRAVTITRVGTNQKYSDGWDQAFGGKKGGGKAAQKKAAPSKKAAAKKKGKK